MTQTQERTTAGNARKSNPPAFIAYSVSDQGRGRKFWTRLGGAWPQKNGEGFTVFVNVLPIDFDGRIVLMTPKEQDQADAGQPEGAVDAAAPAEDDEIPF
ncbi:MAG: hypothetical protein F9K38_10135 [Pseudorhodoplanes sp.]|nr:MAG: hypothetical protein F9K38_10135 [Pseudorhodoplanes sp.]